jgi:hypothetical protein
LEDIRASSGFPLAVNPGGPERLFNGFLGDQELSACPYAESREPTIADKAGDVLLGNSESSGCFAGC